MGGMGAARSAAPRGNGARVPGVTQIHSPTLFDLRLNPPPPSPSSSYRHAALASFGRLPWDPPHTPFPQLRARTYISFVITAVVCLWIPWICAWLHQWHPLIQPERAPLHKGL
jgi:hypothetical protein